MNIVLFKSDNEVWATPQDLFDELNKEFGFNMDPCALPENAKCEKYFTPQIDGLKQSKGNKIYKRAAKIWILQKRGPVSVNDRNFLRV